MRVIFMGSPEFAVNALNSLLKSKNEVVAVYTKAPKPSGRGQKLTKSPVHIIAEESGIEVCTPTSLKLLVEQEKFEKFKPDVVVVAAYGLMLPKEILDVPKYSCINIHPSLLPRWRGAAPIQHTILAGDQETGVSIIQLNEGLDSGPVLKQKKFLIEKNDNYKTLHNKLSKLGSDLLMGVIDEIEKHLPLEQSNDGVCYADKMEDYKIYASDICEVAYRKVKAFYPKAFVKIEHKRIRILDADFEVNTSLTSGQGKIINDNMHISLESGTLIPKVVQMEGRSPCNTEDFVRGLKFSMVRKFIE
ncbi:methionyl-tRNA formyltransferase [Wolbachia endosymbiont of Litomosoides brasiliensis]|uniref:methionyl-tRNA formyltransferase n=1 Tax=Wolbachia endosymbiont of Litomosoides brasiliensis TaxID=1812117 RepID=UPI00158C1490|nr:methionyl-tRNA formyltransferase [Wolbachia endosymbiont of Litomosoides brasiliensis]NUY39312.1 methionyl-tRNA formyltransferase [Wolbachia endosymbiont of Litomosoides brasiliensis]